MEFIEVSVSASSCLQEVKASGKAARINNCFLMVLMGLGLRLKCFINELASCVDETGFFNDKAKLCDCKRKKRDVCRFFDEHPCEGRRFHLGSTTNDSGKF